MTKYVFINVQGISDVITKVFDDDTKLYDYLLEFFEGDDEYSLSSEYSPDDLMPSGTVYLDGQTLKVIEIN